MSNFIKIRPVGAKLFHTEGRIDRRTDMTKLIVAFRNFANAPKKYNWRAFTEFILLKTGTTGNHLWAGQGTTGFETRQVFVDLVVNCQLVKKDSAFRSKIPGVSYRLCLRAAWWGEYLDLKWRKWLKVGENCKTGSERNVTATEHDLNDQMSVCMSVVFIVHLENEECEQSFNRETISKESWACISPDNKGVQLLFVWIQ